MLHCYFIGLLYRSHWPLTFMLFYIPMYVKKIFNIHYKSARSQTVSDDVFLYLFLRKLRKCKQKSNQHIIKKRFVLLCLRTLSHKQAFMSEYLYKELVSRECLQLELNWLDWILNVYLNLRSVYVKTKFVF